MRAVPLLFLLPLHACPVLKTCDLYEREICILRGRRGALELRLILHRLAPLRRQTLFEPHVVKGGERQRDRL